MEKSAMIEAALSKLMDDMDGMEGDAAMQHDMSECPDPMGCTMHDSELGQSLTPNPKPDLAIEIKGPEESGDSLLGKSMEEGSPAEGAEGKLSPEEAEVLKKLLK
jgi:hypothetical protein